MPLTELFPTVNQLSHQDKLRLMNFLLIAIAQEDGITLEQPEITNIALINLVRYKAEPQ